MSHQKAPTHHTTYNLREMLEQARQERFQRFAKLKTSAIQLVGHQLHSALELLQYRYECGNEQFARIELPHEVFSWSISDCIKRRKYSLAWLKLLQKQYSCDCLRKRKVIVDFGELKKYLKLVIDWHAQKCLDFDIREVLRSLQYFVNYDQHLAMERDNNWPVMLNFLRRQQTMEGTERLSVVKSRFNLDDMKLDYTLKTKFRYAEQFTTTDVETVEEDPISNNLQNQIDACLKSIENEKYCSTCTINFYYSEIQSLKDRLKEWEAAYDEEYERITNQVNYSLLTIEKMGHQRAFLEDQRIRFKEEIEAIQEIEKQEAEKQRLAEIEKAMQFIVQVEKKTTKNNNKKPEPPQAPKPKVAKVEKEEPESIKTMMKGVMKIKSTKVPKNLKVKNFVKKINKKFES